MIVVIPLKSQRKVLIWTVVVLIVGQRIPPGILKQLRMRIERRVEKMSGRGKKKKRLYCEICGELATIYVDGGVYCNKCWGERVASTYDIKVV